MEELLFRGARKDNGELVYGLPWKKKPMDYNDRVFIHLFPNGDDEDEYVPIDPKSLAQYSGVDDINGERIFEGDLLKGVFWLGMERTGVCEFRYGSFGVKWFRGTVVEFTPFTSVVNIRFEVVKSICEECENYDAECKNTPGITPGETHREIGGCKQFKQKGETK